MKILHCTTPACASRADLRRQRLLDVARRLFTERGFHATGVAQIAASSGIRVGQIYRDFQSKDDIIAALVEADLAAFLEEETLADAVARGDLAAVRGWIGRFVTVDEPIEQCRMMTEIAAEGARNPRIAELQRAIDARVRASLMSALAALDTGKGCTPRRALLADLILTLGSGLVNRRIVHPALDADALAAEIGRLVDARIDRLQRDPAPD